MRHTIDVNAHIKAIKILEEKNSLEQQLAKINNEIVSIDQLITVENSQKEALENELKAKLSLIKQVLNRKQTKTKRKSIENQIKGLTASLDKRKERRQSLQNERDQLLNKLNFINKELSSVNPFSYEAIFEGKLMITDSSAEVNEFPTIEKDGNAMLEQHQYEDIALVHCTDFFPHKEKIMTNYDGDKYGIITKEYDGVRKQCKGVSHRHTVHFILNNRVKTNEGLGIGGGNWDAKKFMVIEPLSYHIDQFLLLNPSDSYTWGSVDLKQPIYLVRKDCLSELPLEVQNSSQTVLYEGDPSVCLKRTLNLLGYPIFNINANDQNHFLSDEMRLETALDNREIVMQYIKDNTFNCKANICLSVEDLANLLDVYLRGNFSHVQLKDATIVSNISQEQHIPEEFIHAIVNFGIKALPDGNFTFDTDENIYKVIKDNSLMDISGIKRVYDAYINYTNTKSNKSERISMESLKNMPIKELFEFQNHKIAKAFFETLSSFTRPFTSKDSVIDFYMTEDGLNYAITDILTWRKLEEKQIVSKEDTIAQAYQQIDKLIKFSNIQKDENVKGTYSRGYINLSLLIVPLTIIVGIVLAIIIK